MFDFVSGGTHHKRDASCKQIFRRKISTLRQIDFANEAAQLTTQHLEKHINNVKFHNKDPYFTGDF